METTEISIYSIFLFYLLLYRLIGCGQCICNNTYIANQEGRKAECAPFFDAGAVKDLISLAQDQQGSENQSQRAEEILHFTTQKGSTGKMNTEDFDISLTCVGILALPVLMSNRATRFVSCTVQQSRRTGSQ